MAERNAGLSDDQKMLYRIGINLADVIVDGEVRLRNECFPMWCSMLMRWTAPSAGI